MSEDADTTIRATALGATLSGKTRFFWNRWVRKEPRLVIVDHTGEWARNRVAAKYTVGFPETVDALIEKTSTGTRWRIICDLNEEEIARLTRLLVPERDIFQRSPCVSMGGMAIYLPEVDQSIDLGSREEKIVKSLWRRGRHAKLRVYADTQSLSSCSKEVTKNVEVLAILNFDEPKDVAYIEAKIRSPEHSRRAFDHCLKPYHVAVWLRQYRELVLLPPGPKELLP